jgi:cytoskeletal protein RodZ
MPTLGEELRRLREARGVSLTEISETTRIGTRFLKAIEGDNFSILPGGIFTRSFIRAYARYVGMDEEDAVQRYQQQLGGSAPQAVPSASSRRDDNAEASPSPTIRTASTSKRTPAVTNATRRIEPVPSRSAPPGPRLSRVIIAAIILVFVAAAVFTLVRQLNAGSAERAARAPSNAGSNPAQPPPTQSPGSSSAVASSQPAQPAAGEAARPVAPADTGSRLVVRLEASSDSWIKYQVDDAIPTQMILKPGQIEEIPAALNQIRLNFGNRQTLKLIINDRQAFFPPETPKFAAQVVISRDNLQTFFQ